MRGKLRVENTYPNLDMGNLGFQNGTTGHSSTILELCAEDVIGMW